MVLKTVLKSDLVGAMASGLCLVHCIATPFLFIAQSCTVSDCCASGPTWWSSIDYIFIGITLMAVYQSGKITGKPWMKYVLYATWTILSLLILNEKLAFLPMLGIWKYAAAFALIGLHLCNLKFCRCVEESCSLA